MLTLPTYLSNRRILHSSRCKPHNNKHVIAEHLHFNTLNSYLLLFNGSYITYFRCFVNRHVWRLSSVSNVMRSSLTYSGWSRTSKILLSIYHFCFSFRNCAVSSYLRWYQTTLINKWLLITYKVRINLDRPSLLIWFLYWRDLGIISQNMVWHHKHSRIDLPTVFHVF